MFSKEVLKIVRRLQEARLSLMKKQPFYAVLLLHMQFSIDPMCETAYTDGTRIAFCPDFIDKLSDEELEFVLMHEVLHVALNHCNRHLDFYDYDGFNTACDIVVNSNILYSFNMDASKITLKDYGVSMHVAPNGKEGFKYTAEEVYQMVHAQSFSDNNKNKKTSSSNNKDDNKSENGDREEYVDQDENVDTPARSDGGFDDHTYWESSREEDNTSDQGTDGNENVEDEESSDQDSGKGEESEEALEQEGLSRDIWLQRMIEATQIAKQISIREGSKSCGNIPLGAQRIVDELTEPQTDWRTVLDTFIQEEIVDYSFNPPDRRFQDSIFLLPDYNEKDDSVKDILFMIDTSGSMSDEMITQAYSEIYGAIQQFGGKLQGWLGFFDASVVEPKEFTDEDEFAIIRPLGGGGTSFHCIFEYVQKHIDEINPSSIVILTDGYAPWPDEDAAMDIPVLWLINNEEAQPPWGKVTRIKVEQQGASNEQR